MKRISNRALTRRRQTWLDLPASGIEEVGHGRSTGADEGSDQAKEKAREVSSERRCMGVEKFTVEVAGVFKPDLKAVMRAHGFNNQQEIHQNLIRNLIAADFKTQAKMLRGVTTPYAPSEKVLGQFRAAGLLYLAKHPGEQDDQIVDPKIY